MKNKVEEQYSLINTLFFGLLILVLLSLIVIMVNQNDTFDKLKLACQVLNQNQEELVNKVNKITETLEFKDLELKKIKSVLSDFKDQVNVPQNLDSNILVNQKEVDENEGFFIIAALAGLLAMLVYVDLKYIQYYNK